jgi:hypothetical protein
MESLFLAEWDLDSSESEEKRGFIKTHPRLTLLLVTVGSILLILALVEISLRVFFGLGDPVLYQSSPLYGYRPQINQIVRRFDGAEIRINNLGLRANEDWNADRTDKILFLGNSVTYGGTYISNDDLFSAVAVRGLRGYRSGNAGVNGWGVENIHALVVDYGFLPASVYVTVLQDMDFERGLSKFAGQPFWNRKPLFALQELFLYFLYNQWLAVYDGHDRFVSLGERKSAIQRSAKRLKEMDDFLRSKGFVHLIYFSTDSHQLLNGRPADSLVTKGVEQYGLHVNYIRKRPEVLALSDENKNQLFSDWNHLTVAGHQLWGQIVGSDLNTILFEQDQVHVIP